MVKNQSSIKSYRVNVRFFSHTQPLCSLSLCSKRHFLTILHFPPFLYANENIVLLLFPFLRGNKLYTFFCVFFKNFAIWPVYFDKTIFREVPMYFSFHFTNAQYSTGCLYPSYIRSQTMDTWVISSLPRLTMLPWLNLGICHFARVQVDL